MASTDYFTPSILAILGVVALVAGVWVWRHRTGIRVALQERPVPVPPPSPRCSDPRRRVGGRRIIPGESIEMDDLPLYRHQDETPF